MHETNSFLTYNVVTVVGKLMFFNIISLILDVLTSLLIKKKKNDIIILMYNDLC